MQKFRVYVNVIIHLLEIKISFWNYLSFEKQILIELRTLSLSDQKLEPSQASKIRIF